MKSCRFLFLILSLLSLISRAQEAPQLNAAEIRLGLQKLNVVGNVLYIAAHPDDENTRLLAYLAKERKFRTGYLSITRGDGGQNLIGPEQSELLGLIRTQELLAARKVDGAEQYFTRANDFGFSKTSEETLRLWGKEQILADVVWVIRNFQPDVIITRFPEDTRAGHGHHAASAILAREAFFAAADAKRFPEQLKYVKPWQATRIMWNTSSFNNTISDNQLKLNVGLYNPLLGKSYGEISAESRTNHKSQGFGSANQRGDVTEFFNPVAGKPVKEDLFEGINTGWSRIEGGDEISRLINKAEKEFDGTDPSKSVETLLKIKSLINKTGNKTKLAEIDALILASTGIWFEMNSRDPHYALGDSIPVRFQAIARVPTDFKYDISISESFSKQNNIKLQPNHFISVNTKIKLSDKLSQPYWLQSDHGIGAYIVENRHDAGMPENNVPISGLFAIRIGENVIHVHRPVVYKFTDPVKGEVYQNIAITPPVTATLTDKAYIFIDNAPKKITIHLRSFRDNTSGTLQPKIPAGWRISPQNINFSLPKKGSVETKEFFITPGGAVTSGDLLIHVKVGNQTFNQEIREIKYDHIPAQTLFPKAKATLEQIDLKTTGEKKIAYIAGAGDLVAESLKQIGYDVTILSAEQVITANLSDFEAIITGIRLFNIDEHVKIIQPKLLDYVAKGGVLLAQYNVINNFSPLLAPNIGPYPFKLSRDRVTEENAEVTFVDPEHPALNSPNKITKEDFEGWVQERGLYFTTEVDKAYSSVLSFNDTGANPNTGSLIIANYGKGKFVYTSLSFFRQLPAGVPGAYRLFVNLISK